MLDRADLEQQLAGIHARERDTQDRLTALLTALGGARQMLEILLAQWDERAAQLAAQQAAIETTPPAEPGTDQ